MRLDAAGARRLKCSIGIPNPNSSSITQITQLKTDRSRMPGCFGLVASSSREKFPPPACPVIVADISSREICEDFFCMMGVCVCRLQSRTYFSKQMSPEKVRHIIGATALRVDQQLILLVVSLCYSLFVKAERYSPFGDRHPLQDVEHRVADFFLPVVQIPDQV